jgi:hypothetical protein
MKKTVTVTQAIQQGKRMANTPAIIILAVLIITTLYLVFSGRFPIWTIPAGCLLSVGIAWLYRSIMIASWKSWAFKNVKDTHELTIRATEEKFIWAKDIVPEIITPTEKKEPGNRTFEDDPTVPEESIIYYSKSKNFLEMAYMLAVAVGGGVMAAGGNAWGLAIVVGGLIMAFIEYSEATDTTPQITISDKGIKTVSAGFQEWDKITDEEVYRQRRRKHPHYHLKFDYPGVFEDMNIDDLDIDRSRLRTLLKIYRERSVHR